MKTPDSIEQNINRIRLAIYEETKHLTTEQRVERTNKIAEAAARKYGFKFIRQTKAGKFE
jgi:hypothetical protein